jgi:alpha-beta hydrolase superfamily lysophospholipase
MGAMIATAYLPGHQAGFAGAIISGGGIAPDDTPPPAPVADLAAAVSRDPAVVQAYRDDPLNYHGLPPPSRAAAMRGWRSRLRELAGEITLPIILMAGAGSPLGDGPRSAAMYEAVRSQDKTLKLYDGLYHEIFNEPERAVVFADLEAWLDGRT